MKNELVSESDIYIYADGPKTGINDQGVIETRRLISENRWNGRVTIIPQEKNRGLAASIIAGVSDLVNKFGKVIVLEDDIVTSPGFLRFINDSLDKYENSEIVMHVCGFAFPVIDSAKVGAETFFYRVPTCWGWGTWKRAWQFYNDDAKDIFLKLAQSNRMREFDFNYSGVFLGQVNANRLGIMRTWAVKWYASTFLRNGLALHPYKSMVDNIGFDGSGDNSGATNNFKNSSLCESVTISDIGLTENQYVVDTMKKFYRNTLSQRLKSFLANRIKNFYLMKYFNR
jgi:hypothetical protein